MGALTSKPFSFTARSWELTDRITYDFNDTFFSPIKVSFRGGSIIRILPEFTSDSLTEWIGDRIRFSYDAFSSSNPQDQVFNLKANFSLFWVNFFVKRYSFSASFNHSHLDISAAYRLKNIDLFTGFFPFSSVLYDFRKFFYSSFNNLGQLILNYKFFYFLGVNLRYTQPVISVNFRRLSFSNDAVIFNIGFFTNNLLGDINLGFSNSTLTSFFRNSSRLNRFFVVNLRSSFLISIPQFSTYILEYTKHYVQPDQICFFFSRPLALSFAEISYSVVKPVYSNFLKFYLPHPFNYVSYHFKSITYQKIDSLFSNFFYGNSVKLFSKFASENFTYCLVPVNNTLYFTYSVNNFYSHFFNSSFNKSSLNILVSLRRQQDLRSPFQYYN